MFSALPGFGLGKVIPHDPLWSNVVLALHGDGSNGSTTFTDEKSHTASGTYLGSTQLATGTKKFGTASIKFDGGGLVFRTGSALADFTMGTADFMFRAWLWVDSVGAGTTRVIFDSRRNGGSAEGFVAFIDTLDRLRFYSATSYFTTDATTWPTDQWVHLAITRASGALYVFRGGTVVTNGSSFTANLTDGRLCIGEVNPEYQGTTAFKGFMDDVELSIGDAVYTGAYTPPTAAFPNS